jgi:hypothetical protein
MVMTSGNKEVRPSEKEAILYISYDSILEPLGRSQVYRYIESLSENFKFYLVSFEKSSRSTNRINVLMLDRFRQLGVTWIPLRYHKSPRFIATLYDVARCVLVSLLMIKRNNIRLVHARSFLPVFMAFVLRAFVRLKIIYDTRGFWIDERVAAGFIRDDTLICSLMRKMDKYFVSRSSHVVVLSDAALREFTKNPESHRFKSKFSVIPTCVSLEQFNLRTNTRSRNSSLVVGYVGSVSVTNMFDQFMKVLIQLQDMSLRFQVLIVNKGEHAYINSKLSEIGFDCSRYKIQEIDHSQVHLLLREMDLAVFFKKQGLSSVGCSPTRFAEFMATGVPCLFNSGIGDLDYFRAKYSIGVSVSDFTADALRDGVRDILKLLDDEGLSLRCRKLAEQYFGLAYGVNSYSLVYSSLLKNDK